MDTHIIYALRECGFKPTLMEVDAKGAEVRFCVATRVADAADAFYVGTQLAMYPPPYVGALEYRDEHLIFLEQPVDAERYYAIVGDLDAED